jgi:hypothetical protein
VLGPFPAQSFAVLVGPSNGTSGAIEWPLVAVAESLLVLGAALGIVGATKLSARRTSRAS